MIYEIQGSSTSKTVIGIFGDVFVYSGDEETEMHESTLSPALETPLLTSEVQGEAEDFAGR